MLSLFIINLKDDIDMKRLIIILLFFFFVSSGVAQTDGSISAAIWKPIKEINTKFHEFSMTISPDGRYMIFGSNRPGGLGDKDLWISYYKEGKWSKPENLRKLNSRFHDQEPFITYDGNALLFNSDRDGGYGVGDIYISYRQGNSWTIPQNLGPIINTRDSEKTPSVSMDNKELYFARIPVDYQKRSLKKKEIQIYQCQKKNNLWQRPVKLGPPVNMMSFDYAPRIMPDNKTLLFCSARKGGKGAFDIWRVKRQLGGSQKWEQLQNLSTVNSKHSEIHFAFTIKGDRMYKTLLKNKKDYDIYEYKVEEQFSDPTITLQGRITNLRDGSPVDAQINIELFNKKGEHFSVHSDKLTGRYSVTLPEGEDYSFIVEAPGFMFFSKRIDLTRLKNSAVTNVDMGLHPLKKGESIVVDTIYFDPDSYKLRDESRIALNRVVEILNKNRTMHLLIKGHVAKVAKSKVDPKWLSQKRAEEVMNYLKEKGISSQRLEAKGYGSSKPVGDNNTEAGRKLNRRTEFEIIKE